MIKDGQLIEIKITGCSINWYKEQGYNCQVGDIIQVKPEHLPKGSHHKIVVICDNENCKEESTKQYKEYLRRINSRSDGKFLCQKCCFKDKEFNNKKVKIAKQTFLQKYGVDNPNKVSEIREKTKQTNMKNYGVEYSFQSDEIKEKISSTMKKRYGTEFYSQSEEGKQKIQETLLKKYGKNNPMKVEQFKQKAQNTNLKRYGYKNCSSSSEIKKKREQTNLKRFGVKFTLSSSEVREKGKQTLLKKYGVDNPAKSSLIQKKIRKTLFKYGKVRTSKQQKKIYDIIKNKYEICFLNYPMNNYSLDCMLIIDDIKIDIEYDGWYWHTINNMQDKDKIRDELAYKQGYKILRIKGGTFIPNNKDIFDAIQELKEKEINYKEIILPEWKRNIKQNTNY